MRIRTMTVWTVAICLSSVALLEAQPGGRRGFAGGGMGFGVSPEQVFALLAFDGKFEVTDRQLLALREALKPLYVEQRQMMARLARGGPDFQALREELRQQQTKMLDKILGALATALRAEQVEAVKTHLYQGPLLRQRGGGSQGGGF